jgi:predicted RNA binding protein YcfA (HicA-like mRNA interferase family)
MNFREAEKKVTDDGWQLERIKGSHHIYKHPSKPGRVIIANHPGDLKVGTLKAIFKQARLKQ